MTTPQARTAPGGTGDSSGGNRIAEYLLGVRDELKKAQWPSRQELFQLTKVVLVIIAVVAVFCGTLDGILSYITNWLFQG